MVRLKPLLIVAIIFVVVLGVRFNLHQYFSFAYIKSHLENFRAFTENNYWGSIASFTAIYIGVTAISLPPGGATVLTLLAGAIFGLGPGTVVVSFASSIGATCAFLLARFFLRNLVRNRFDEKLRAIDRGISRDGGFYLLSLRLIPVFPFFLINLCMSVTALPVRTFYFVSQLGMLPGTLAYVNAGVELGKINNLGDVASPGLLLSFTILGLMPLACRWILDRIKRERAYRGFKRPPRSDYNMVVIGGGAAGLVTSYICAAARGRVALIEARAMGGDCLNTGCVPSKALLKSARVAHLVRYAANFGIQGKLAHVDFPRIMERVRSVIASVAPHDSVERYTGLGVECISGVATINSPWEVKVGGRKLTTRSITIATGAHPFVPPIPGLKDEPYLTSDNLWELSELPQSLIILGGGPVGCELAQCFARFGSHVTLVEQLSRLLPGEDGPVGTLLAQVLTHEGVRVCTAHRAVSVSKGTLICDHAGTRVEIIFDRIVVAVGRVANTEGLGLDRLGIRLNPNGTVQVDEFMRSEVPNIFACGDVAGPYQLTHMASHQAWYCALNGLFGRFKKFPVSTAAIPWCTYTDPEVATVGLTETRARQTNQLYDVTTYNLADLDRALCDGETQGFVRVLTAPGSDRILGATIVASQASSMLLEFVSAIQHGFGLNKILSTIHVYPSYGEANKYAAGAWKRTRLSARALNLSEAYLRWDRGRG